MAQEWNIWIWSFSKAIDSMKSFFFDIKIYQKEQNLYAYIPQKSFHRKHTIKHYVLNELKRYIKYNSEKLGFLKLRNKFFDRLRNQGFRKYSLTKKLWLCHTHLLINIYQPMTKFILLLCRRRKPRWP